VAAGDSGEGIEAYAQAIKLRPGAAVFHFNLGNALLDTGSVDEAVQAYRHSLALQPERSEMRSNYLYSLQFQPGVTSAILAAAQEEWNSRHGRAEAIGDFGGATFDPEKRLRLGFLSSDFGHHPVGYFLVPLLENLDAGGAEIFCYSNRAAPDDMTHRLRRRRMHGPKCAH
jgi:protein O-GlcNAc transferase